jgi:hypothetical protein
MMFSLILSFVLLFIGVLRTFYKTFYKGVSFSILFEIQYTRPYSYFIRWVLYSSFLFHLFIGLLRTFHNTYREMSGISVFELYIEYLLFRPAASEASYTLYFYPEFFIITFIIHLYTPSIRWFFENLLNRQ